MPQIIKDQQLKDLGFTLKPRETLDGETFSYRTALIETEHSYLEVINEDEVGKPTKQFLNLEIIEDGYRTVTIELLQKLIPLIKQMQPVLNDIPTDYEIIKGH